MNITVDYAKRQYGLGDTVRKYQVTIREVSGLYVESSASPIDNYYQSKEVEIEFRGNETTPGRGWDHWADSKNAEVLGGRLEMSHDAARQLAHAILQFLSIHAPQGQASISKFDIEEKPLKI